MWQHLTKPPNNLGKITRSGNVVTLPHYVAQGAQEPEPQRDEVQPRRHRVDRHASEFTPLRWTLACIVAAALFGVLYALGPDTLLGRW